MKTEKYIRKLKLRKKAGNRNTQARNAKRFGGKILFLNAFSIAMNTLPRSNILQRLVGKYYRLSVKIKEDMRL